MTPRGPFQPLLFCDSVILCCSASARSIPFHFPFGPRRGELPSWPAAGAAFAL